MAVSSHCCGTRWACYTKWNDRQLLCYSSVNISGPCTPWFLHVRISHISFVLLTELFVRHHFVYSSFVILCALASIMYAYIILYYGFMRWFLSVVCSSCHCVSTLNISWLHALYCFRRAVQSVPCPSGKAGSGAIWDGMPRRHFVGRLEAIPPLLFWEMPYRCVAELVRITMHWKLLQ